MRRKMFFATAAAAFLRCAACFAGSLDEALNVPGGTLSFVTGGAYPWTIPAGAVYAESSNKGKPSSESTISTTMTNRPGDYLEFDFQSWGEGGCDILIFKIDGAAIAHWGEGHTVWKPYRILLTGGVHTAEWTFKKDYSGDMPGDCARIDNVHVISSGPLDDALNVPGGTFHFETADPYPWVAEKGGEHAKSSNEGAGNSESTVSTTVAANPGDYLEFDFQSWGEGGVDILIFKIDGAVIASWGAGHTAWKTYRALFHTAGGHRIEWTFKKDGSVDKPGDHALLRNVRVCPAGSLDEALNVPGGTLRFATDEPYRWLVQQGWAKSSNEGAGNSESTVSTTVAANPGDCLEFDFQSWGESGYDMLIFKIDGVTIASWGEGHTVWETYRTLLTGGVHTAEWTFKKDGSGDRPGDRALLDNVRLFPSGLPLAESLDDALNVPGGTLVFSSGGEYPWRAATLTDYAESSNAGADSTDSAVSTSFTAAEGDVLRFDFQCPSEWYDKLIFKIDGRDAASWNGGDPAWSGKWAVYETRLSAGGHTAAWIYRKDGSVSSREDRALLDNVYAGPPPAKPSAIEVQDISLAGRHLAQAVYRVSPENAADRLVNFAIADTSVASVDARGVVRGVSPGTTELTVTSAADPSVSGRAAVTVAAANAYAVSFDGNGATGGAMADQAFAYGTAQNLRSNAFVRTGYDRFRNWNTAPDGSGVSYGDGQSVNNLTVEPGGSVTLYAQWAGNAYTVRFNANGGAGSMADQAFTYGTAGVLAANRFTPPADSGLHFTGWNTESNGTGAVYADRQKVTAMTAEPGGAVTLYAQWTAHGHTVIWKNDDGTVIDVTTAALGETPEHPDPVKAATALHTYTFSGWLPAVVPVNGDMYYRATYAASPTPYAVSLENQAGQDDWLAGETPEKPAFDRMAEEFEAAGVPRERLMVFQVSNPAWVSQGSPVEPRFTLEEPMMLVCVYTYHWNFSPNFPGLAADDDFVIRSYVADADGKSYGERAPSRGYASEYQNRSKGDWYSFPGVELPAGEYTVKCSHPESWSYNSDSGNAGFCRIYAVPLSIARGASCEVGGVPAGDLGAVPHGSSVTVAPPAKAGRIFYGWEVSPEGAAALAPDPDDPSKAAFTMPVGDVTLTALWREPPKRTLTIESDYGAPEPLAGEYLIFEGSRVSASVASPVDDGGGTRRICTGWTGTGSVPASGAGTNTSFTLSGDSSLTWLWRTEYRLAAAAGEGGAVDDGGKSGWLPEGGEVTLYAAASAGHAFAGWAGDVDGCVLLGVRIKVPMDRPRSIAANFEALPPPPPLTLAGALDAEGLVWTTDAGGGWTPQRDVTFDGEDAAVSGPGASSILQTSLEGPGTLTFRARMSAPAGSVAGAAFYLDGAYVDGLDGECGWQTAAIPVPAGTHTVLWEFWRRSAADEGAAYLDCVEWAPGAAAADHTLTTPVPVPHAWLEENRRVAHGGDYEAAAKADAANGRKVWECYVAGLDPNDPAARFRATIDPGKTPVIGWSPDLAPGRVYTVEGKARLEDPGWNEVPEYGTMDDLGSNRFFRVKVALPDAE